MPKFVTGYLSVYVTVNSGGKQVVLKPLKDLMVNASTYGWESVRVYHGVWLQQLENGWAEWNDAALKLPWSGIQLDQAFPDIRHHQHLDRHIPKASPPSLFQDKTGIKACTLFNQGKYRAQADHPSDHHICGHCLTWPSVCVCVHQERFCHRQIYDQAARKYGGRCYG